MEKHTGFQFLPCGITRGDDLIAVVPLFSQRMHGIRMVSSPPPRTGIPRMGFVIAGSFDTLRQDRKEQYLEIIGTSLKEELDLLAPDHFFMSLPLHFHDTRIFRWLGYTAVPRYTYVYDLSRPLDQLWAEIKGNKRNRIRNALQNGYTIRKGGEVADFYRLIEIRAWSLGMPLPLPGAEYLEDLSRAFPDRFRVYEVFQGEEVMGSVMVTLDRDMQMWLGAPKAMPNANDFLHWSLIREAKEKGFSRLEDVGANTRHLTLFKNQFNPSLALYYTVCRKNLRGRAAEALYHSTRTFTCGKGRVAGEDDAEWERFL